MKIIQLLNDTKSDTLVYFELPETLLQKTYAPGKWTVRQLLHHLADAETVLYDRIRRVISEPKTLVWAFDQDLWCKHLDYEHMPLPLSKNIFQSVRNSIIYLAENHYEKDGSKEFIHSQTGLRTLKDEFDKVALHNRSHLEQIKMAINI